MNKTILLKLTIAIVAFNEESCLPGLLKDIHNQTYPHELMEILLIDSCSKDNTRNIMEQFQKEEHSFYSIQVLTNKEKIQATGWNIAISNYTGDVLARIDAHTKVSPDYSEKVMKNIVGGEKVTGGIRPAIIEKETQWAKALLQIENAFFGSSFNLSRRSNEKQYVKTMFHAAYSREVLDKVGYFNVNLLRTEDNEYHYRIRKEGYKLYYDPSIVSFQYARSNYRKMINQKYSNGYWIGKTLKICPKCISLYHLVPLAFLIAISMTTVLALLGLWQMCIIMWTMYSLFAIGSTICTGIQNGFTKYHLVMPFLFLILHLSYGIGTGIGVVSKNERKQIK